MDSACRQRLNRNGQRRAVQSTNGQERIKKTVLKTMHGTIKTAKAKRMK